MSTALSQGQINSIRARLGLDTISERRDWVFTAEAADVLGVGEPVVRKAAEHEWLAATPQRRYGHKAPYHRYPIVDVARATDDPPEWLRAARQRRHKSAQTAAERKARVDAAVAVGLPRRRSDPARVVAHLGPTNSGKTHDALVALAEAGWGTYAAPLRMLAYEAYDRLTSRLGNGAVGLVTGEERITEGAPILCCTAEMAPVRGGLLVLDEVQWADDPERGWAWTRLLAGAEYEEIRLCGAPDALPLVHAVFPAAEVVLHDRLCPLGVAVKPQSIASVPAGSVLVCFSRKAVLHTAGLLREGGRSVAVLYGAMAPAVRRSEIARFVSGEAAVVVATDVIGHGINLPVSHVFFCETEKFDGERRRQLHLHEVAQIAGRAGRFGMEAKGTVGWVTGVPGMKVDEKVVRRLATGPRVVVAEEVVGYRKVTKGMLGPSLEQLGCESAEELPKHLEAWKQAAWSLTKDAPWITISPIAPLLGRLVVLASKKLLGKLCLEDAWRLARSPLDAGNDDDAELLGRCAQALVKGASLRSIVSWVPEGPLELVERTARGAAGLRWFTLAFPGVGEITHGEACIFEELCAEKAKQLLSAAVTGGVRRCRSCGALTAPWFTECDSCHSRGRYGNWHDDEDDDEPSPAPKKNKNTKKPTPRDLASRSERKERRDEILKVAAEEDPVLARPQHFPRQLWIDLLPRLRTLDAKERQEMVAAFSKKDMRAGFAQTGPDEAWELARNLSG